MPSDLRSALPPIPFEQRRAAFAQLAPVFAALSEAAPWPGHTLGLTRDEYEAFDAVVRSAQVRNGWYTEANVRHALGALAQQLAAPALQQWTDAYPELHEERVPRTVGIIMAGNIPLVGFHDLLCVLLSGHTARVKPSSDDAGLVPAVIELLRPYAPELAGRATVVPGKLGTVDALIATGSTNTARYFEHYFGHLPRIVRKGRTSVAVLDGTESDAELAALGEDVFRYFGLGCRNVSKVYLPQDFELDRLFGAFFPWKDIIVHAKYANNYDYNKAVWLMEQVPMMENGFLVMKEDTAIASPVAALYYERYTDRAAVMEGIRAQASAVQCIVGHGQVPFGQAQCPGPSDYADGVDTLAFLLGLDQSAS